MIKNNKEYHSKFEYIAEINEYLETLRLDKSVNTILYYITSIDKFFHFINISNFENVKNINPVQYREFQTHLKSSGLATSSINANMRVIKALFYWLEKNNYIEKSPLIGLKGLKEPVREKPFMTDEDVTIFMKACKNIEERVMFAIFFNTGLRSNELIQLELRDIDEFRIHLYGKGDKEDFVFMTDSILELFNAYLIYRRTKLEKFNERNNSQNPISYVFFSSVTGKKYTERGIELKFKTILRRAGFSEDRIKSLHVHSTRHTFATKWLENHSLKSTQVALRHSNISTTGQIYAHVGSRQLEKEFREQKVII